LHAFVQSIVSKYPKSATYKVHSLTHIVDDVENFGCRTGTYSAYVYENKMGMFPDLVRNGREVIKQMRNRLMEISEYLKPTREDGLFDLDDDSTETYLTAVKENDNNMHLSPFRVKDVVKNEREGLVRVICEAFKFSNKFPNNIICLDDNVICVIDTLFERPCDDSIMVSVRKFKTVYCFNKFVYTILYVRFSC
jgi:hypothetical protein